jgi:hypothetical protein
MPIKELLNSKWNCTGIAAETVLGIYIYVCTVCFIHFIFYVNEGAYLSESELDKTKARAVLLHAMKALGRRGGIAPTHSRH